MFLFTEKTGLNGPKHSRNWLHFDLNNYGYNTKPLLTSALCAGCWDYQSAKILGKQIGYQLS